MLWDPSWGVPLSGCSWTKSSLPSRCGGINLRNVSIRHAHAAFLAADTLSQELGPSPHSDSIVTALSIFASRSDWLCLEDTDVPLHQRSQSTAIDEALFQHLLSTAPSTRAQALLSALPHAGDWLNGVPSTTQEWVFTFRTNSFALAYMLLAWSASTLLLLLLP